MKILYGIVALFLIFSVISSSAQESSSVKLLPTDDAYVMTDLSDPNDPLKLMQTNNGDTDTIQIFSTVEAVGIPGQYISIAYLKFDLSGQETKEIINAQLKMYSNEVSLPAGPKNVPLFQATDNNWNENQITYLQRPPFPDIIASTTDVSASGVWNSWDITELVKANQDSEISVVLLFETILDVGESVSFYSKDTEKQEFAPYLELSFSPSTMGSSQAQDSFAYTLIPAVIGAAAVAFFVGMQVSKRKSPTRQTTQKQTIRKVQCQGCGKMIPDYYKFCPACGYSFS